jgi:RNA polymerase-binding transcription factor DksA
MKTADQLHPLAPTELVHYLPEIRTALEQQRRFRLDQLGELVEAAVNAPPQAPENVHDEVSEILRTGAAKALVEVEDALARMRAGRYGICEQCATPIAVERLEILPMSRYCMRCQHELQTRPGPDGSAPSPR